MIGLVGWVMFIRDSVTFLPPPPPPHPPPFDRKTNKPPAPKARRKVCYLLKLAHTPLTKDTLEQTVRVKRGRGGAGVRWVEGGAWRGW